MDISQAITIGTSILTLVTTVLILLTLIEMRAQRKASYRPEVVVKKDYWISLFYRSGRLAGMNRLFICDSRVNPLQPGPESYFQIGSVGLDASNVGLASAKHLRIHWDVDLNALASFVVSHDDSRQTKIAQEKHFLSIMYPQRHLSVKYGLQTLSDLDLDYMLPATATNEIQKLQIPQFYLHAMMILIMLLEDSQRSATIPAEIEKMPKLHLVVTYQDLENALFRKEFQIDIAVIAVMSVSLPLDAASEQDGDPAASPVCSLSLTLSPR